MQVIVDVPANTEPGFPEGAPEPHTDATPKPMTPNIVANSRYSITLAPRSGFIEFPLT